MFNSIFKHRITKNVGALVILQAVTYVTPIIILVYLTRVLGVSTYGVVAFGYSIVNIASVFLDIGFSLSAVQRISLLREDKKYIANFLGTIIIIKMAAIVIVGMVIVGYALTTVKYADYRILFVLFILPLAGACFQPVWFFAGVEKMRYITLFMVISKILTIFFILLLVNKEADYLYVPVADGISQISGAMIGYILIRRIGYTIAIPDYRDVINTIRFTSGFFVSRISVTAYIGGGVFILGLFASPVVVATYSLAERVYQAMQNVFYPVVQAIYPYMSKERNILLLLKIFVAMFIVAILGACFGFIIAPTVVPIIFGQNWIKSIPILNVFFLAIIVHIMAVMSGYPLSAALNRIDVANTSVIYGALVYAIAVSMLLLLGSPSAIAFAWIMVLSEFCVLSYRAIVLWPKVYNVVLS